MLFRSVSQSRYCSSMKIDLDETIIIRDGRIGPLWEHYIFLAAPIFVIFKLATLVLGLYWWVGYISLFVAFILALKSHHMDKQINSSGLRDEVDQRVPLWSRIFAILFVLLLILNLVIDAVY